MSETTHCQRVLDVLADGRWHSTSDLYRKAGPLILHSRIAELRTRGHDIVHEHIPGKKGPAAHRYQWVDAPPRPAQAVAQFRLDGDDHAPRTERERFRCYRVRNGGEPELVATCGSMEAVGVTLCTLGDEGEFEDTCVGILDALDRWDDKKGKYVGRWIIRPWSKA